MSKNAHTPGPWFSVKNGAYKWVESPAHTVCVFYQWNSDGSMSESEDAAANARLISAAPDLLAALETILEICEVGDEDRIREFAENIGYHETYIVAGHIAAAKAAISKAKGEA